MVTVYGEQLWKGLSRNIRRYGNTGRCSTHKELLIIFLEFYEMMITGVGKRNDSNSQCLQTTGRMQSNNKKKELAEKKDPI